MCSPRLRITGIAGYTNAVDRQIGHIMQKDKASPLVGIIELVLTCLLVVGIKTFAAPCGVHDDGSIGTCHWAAQAVFGLGIVGIIVATVRIFERDEGERRGLSFALACLGVLAVCMPGILIDLCATSTMRCHTAMHPFVIVVGVAIALVGATDLVVRLLRIGKQGH